MSWVEAARNAAADALAGPIDHVRIHSGPPGATGGDNRIGDSLAITYGGAAGGVAQATNLPLDFPVPGATTVTHVTYYTAASALRRTRAVTNESFVEAGTYRVTSADVTAADEA